MVYGVGPAAAGSIERRFTIHIRTQREFEAALRDGERRQVLERGGVEPVDLQSLNL